MYSIQGANQTRVTVDMGNATTTPSDDMTTSTYSRSSTFSGLFWLFFIVAIIWSFVSGRPSPPVVSDSPTYHTIVDGHAMLPLRFFSEAFDMDVDYDSLTNTAILTAEGIFVTHELGTNTISVNGEIMQFDVASVVVNGTAFASVQMIADIVGAMVEWDEFTRTVTISV